MLHIGDIKTASTSIQATLYHNIIPQKYSRKYHYLRSWFENHSFALFISTAEFSPFKFSLAGTKYDKSRETYKDLLWNELKTCYVETLVLSAEMMSEFTKEAHHAVKNLLMELGDPRLSTIQLVGYVRDPIASLTSAFQTYACYLHYSENDIDSSSVRLSSTSPIESMAEVFGMEQIKLHKFEDAIQHEYGPVGFFYENFLSFTREDISRLDIKKENESMSQIAVDLCCYINAAAPMYDKNHQPTGLRKRFDLALIRTTISGPKFKLSKDNRYKHLYRCEEKVNYLKVAFGIHYSYEKMKEAIDSDIEPSHIPTKQNLSEIDSIFYKVHSVIQDCIISYLQQLTYSLDEDEELLFVVNQLIIRLTKKKKTVFNKIFLFKQAVMRRLRVNAQPPV